MGYPGYLSAGLSNAAGFRVLSDPPRFPCRDLWEAYNAGLQKLASDSGEQRMASSKRGTGRRKVGRKKRRMRSKIRHRK
jgi:hypothetical protein